MRQFCFFLIPILSLGQEIYVRSEFQRPAPDGTVYEADKMNQRGREVLSPPALRNAFTTVHVTLEAPAGTPVVLYVGLNPEDAIKPTLYLEKHLANGEPSELEEVKKLPFNGKIPESGALNFLLDMWVNGDATVQRVKVEPQLWVPDRWIVYPMEVRILEAIVPKHVYQLAKLPEPGFRSDGVIYPRMRELLCGGSIASGAKLHSPTVLSLLDRNIAQDMALGRRLSKASVAQVFLRPTGNAQAEDWCKSAQGRVLEALPTEWFLRVRDILYRSGVN